MKKWNRDWMKQAVTMDTHSLVLMGILIAVEIILSRFVSIQAWNLRIGFGFLPLVIAGMMLGPIRAGIVAGVADLIGTTLFPCGPFFPGFTLTAVLSGMVYGIFLYQKSNRWRILFAVCLHLCFLSLIVNTVWISILYSAPFFAVISTRVIQCAVMLPVELLCIDAVCSKRIRHVFAWR